MCGLVGFSGNKTFNSDNIRFLLFWNAEERNSKDATGIFTPKSDIVKDNISAKSFITTPKLTSKIFSDTALIGHVRAKTVGVNSIANAHPFKYDNIVMAHNGTLENHISLAKIYSLNYADYNVDSQVLAKCISINTLYDDKVKVLEQYQGAAAVIYYNTDTDTLYAYHDAKRPLFYGYINETEMYISSIKDSLEAIHCLDIKEFEINNLYAIKNGLIISKTKYINSIKSNFTEILVAGSKDLVIRHNKKENLYTVRSKVENISGLDYGVARAIYLAGYWLRCDSVGYLNNNSELLKKNELLIYDKWYYVLGAPLGKDYAKSDLHIEVRNEKGESGIIASPIKFNTREFVPQEGKYVIAMNDVVYTKTNVTFLSKGDLAIVKSHVYGSNNIVVKNLDDDTSGSCNVRHFRIATTQEVKKYLEELQKACAIDQKAKEDAVVVPLLLETKTEDNLKKEEPKKEDPKNLLNQKTVITGPLRGYDDLHYDYPTICFIVGSLIEGHQEIMNSLKAGKTQETFKLAKDFEDDLYLLFDPEVLDQMYPLDKQNNDYYDSVIENDVLTIPTGDDESPFKGENSNEREGVVIMGED